MKDLFVYCNCYDLSKACDELINDIFQEKQKFAYFDNSKFR